MPVYPPPGGGGAASNVVFADEGSAVGTGTILNFVGAGVAATFSGGTAVATISGGTVGGSIVLLDEGTVAGTATALNVVGSGGTVSYAGGTATLTLSGAGGGRGEYASKYNPDHETPTTTPAIADEFNGSVNGAWSWTAAPSTDDATTYPGYYYIAGAAGVLNRAWTPGASDLTVACKLLISNTAMTPAIMIGVGDTTGDPSNAVVASLFLRSNDDTNWTLSLYNKDAGVFNVVGGDLSMGEQTRVHTPIWIRLTRTVAGPTWQAFVSLNGLTWFGGSTGSKSLTVGAISFRVDNTAPAIAIDWIRAWTSVVTRVGA